MDAVRKRVQRGTIEHEKDRAGRVRIILDSPDNTSTIRDERPDTTGRAEALIAAKDETIEELRDRIASLERQLGQEQEANSEHRRLLLRALERIPPQLEAPQEAPDDAETVEEAPERADQSATGGGQEGVQRPWWKRIFGG